MTLNEIKNAKMTLIETKMRLKMGNLTLIEIIMRLKMLKRH